MSINLADQVISALKEFFSDTRLYELTIGDGNDDEGPRLMVEAFVADDIVQGVGMRDVIALSTNAYIDVAQLLGQPASLQVSLANRTREHFSGEISEVAMLGSDGGLARYRVRISSWVWRLAHVRNSRVWQDQTVTDIIDSVFDAYAPQARWRWSDDAQTFMQDAAERSYCSQYRESDLEFVERLLTEEGLAWRFEQTEDGAEMVLFADSSALTGVPEDVSSEQDGGIRFHGVRPGEQQDTVQALASRRSVGSSASTVLSYDYKAKKIVVGNAPSRLNHGSKLPPLESYDVPGQYAYASGDQAQRYADIQMESREARSQLWQGRSTVRTLRAGTRLTVTGAPLSRLGEAARYTIVRVLSVGVNNLPTKAEHGLAELFGPIPELLEEAIGRDVPADFELVVKQAREGGYANYFEAVESSVVWRPQLHGSDGRAHPRPTAAGAQSAIVVGADGNDTPNGSDELHCDYLGRVRIRFHWQDSGDATCWVRVAQRSAGGGMGSQFLPRIGQEVLVQFLENDIDRPIIVGALYNGQGEGGIAPTPGGDRSDAADSSDSFGPAHDHATSAQGNLAGGNSPVWHGASSDDAGHRNAAAQWGIRTKEFGGMGYNQLLFDDTDGQGRVQLRTTHAGTELTLGHLIHAADNYRGSFRGLGAELRTDAYGAVRAGAGLLVSSYKIAHSASERDPVGDNSAGIALLKQAVKLGETFSKAATTHQTVGFASHLGAAKANSSSIDDKAAPLQAMLSAVSGMVDSKNLDGPKDSSPGEGKLPHLSKPMIAISAKSGLGVVAGQDIQLANGETVTLMSGQDTQFVTGGQMRVHTGQAIGILGGAVKAGEGGIGLQMIAAKGAIDIQAQSDELKIQARDEINVISANAHIDWAAAKSISLSTAGGANITIDGGNITVQCPGKITIHAGKKSFSGASSQGYRLPILPVGIVLPDEECTLSSTFALDQLIAFANKHTKAEFVLLIVPMFGFDIPAKNYIRLYEKLKNGDLKNPDIVVMAGGHYPASFDNDTRKIYVHRAAATRAAVHNDQAVELAEVLIHEFGHYIDVVLRVDLADKNSEGKPLLAPDAPEDEGAKFSYLIASLDFENSTSATFAHLKSRDYSGPLRINYSDVRNLIKASERARSHEIEGKEGDREYFPAGPEHKDNPNASFGHETIELALLELGGIYRSPGVTKKIYFGNWLRDNSQILDPKVVRSKSMPKDAAKYLSRAALTRIVNVMAKVKFVETPADRAIFAVTEARLGVYRAVEHIDNPTNEVPGEDPRSVDPDFEAPPSPPYLAVDPVARMKRYIANSKQYMRAEIQTAAELGPTPDGLRHFGGGLHVLEDYFAHSNFLEISLIKLGYKKVLPWTAHIPGTEVFPVVTGMFTSEDVVASTAGLIADAMFKVEWEYKEYKKGPGPKDEIMLIVLDEFSDQDLTPNQKAWIASLKSAYGWGMDARDTVNDLPGADAQRRVMHWTFGAYANAYNTVINPLIHAVGNSVDDAQVAGKGYPGNTGSTNPSHSQLAKDHDIHPLHVLASTLAKHAVKRVGDAMQKFWSGDRSVLPGDVASAFLVHPYDCNWQDAIMAQWAKAHPKELNRLEFATDYEYQMVERKKDFEKAKREYGAKWRATHNFVNTYYEDIFGKKSQVKK